jgi:hypothetical protein
MEKNYRNDTDSLFVKLIKTIAQARANEIAHRVGKRSKGDVLGKMIRLVGESTCFVLGSLVKPFTEQKFKHWLCLYSSKTDN